MQNQKLLVILLLICYCASPSFAQSKLQELTENAKIEITNKNFSKAKPILEKALIIASQNDNFLEKAKIENNLGVVYWNTEDYAKSIHFYERSLSTNKALNNDTLVAGSHFNLGLVLKKIGSNDLAIGHFLESIKRFLKIKDQNAQANVYTVLGSLHYNLQSYDKSINYYKLGLSIYEAENNLKGIASVYHNLAQVHLDTENMDEALNCLKQDRLLKTALELTTSSNSALLGKYHQRQGDLDSAEYYYQLSSNERIQEGFQNRVALSYYHLGDFYYQKGDFKLADENLNAAYLISDSLNLKPLTIEILKLSIEVNSQLNQPEQNNKLYPELMVLKDEALGAKNRIEIARFDVEFETAKKDNKIALKEQALSYEKTNNEYLNKKNNYLTLIVTIILILILTIIFFYYKLRQKKLKLDQQNNNLEKKNEIIENLHREFNHRMVNYFQMFGGMLAFDINNTDDYAEKNLLTSYYNRINAMSQIQHYLLHENKSSNDLVMLDFYLSNLIDEIEEVLNHVEAKVKITKSLDSISIDYDKAIRLGIALNELIQNAFKHGFKNIINPHLEISLKDNDGDVTLMVTDNGVGFTGKTNEKRKSMGVDLIRTLLSSIKGEIKYYDDVKRGMKIEIKLLK